MSKPEPTDPTPQETEPKPKPKLVTWRRCVRLEPWEIDENFLEVHWFPSGNIPQHYYPIEAHTQPVETIQQLPEGQQP